MREPLGKSCRQRVAGAISNESVSGLFVLLRTTIMVMLPFCPEALRALMMAVDWSMIGCFVVKNYRRLVALRSIWSE